MMAAVALMLTACGSSKKPTSSSTTATGSASETTATSASGATGSAAAATTSPRTATTSAPKPSPSTSTSVPGQVSPATAAKTSAAIKRLTSYLGRGGVSIAAVDLRTGATYRYGATGPVMHTGSIVKLFILEAVLLRHQDAGTVLSSSDRALATRMIENSDNDAATALWNEIDGDDGLREVSADLGVKHTRPDPGGRWGLTATNAPDYIALLRNLVSPRALSSASRAYILNLMAHVESDQRWGVSAAADPDTTVRLKNGWLDSSSDGGRWLVNSVGIITARGDQVLVAVMTQHGHSFKGGISLVQKLAKLAVATVTPR
jgi:hypothetical protein